METQPVTGNNIFWHFQNKSKEAHYNKVQNVMFMVAQLPCVRWLGQLNLVKWHLTFEGSQYGLSFSSPFWHLEFCGTLVMYFVTHYHQKHLNSAYFNSMEVDVRQGIHTLLLTIFVWIQFLLLLLCSWQLHLFCTKWTACTNKKWCNITVHLPTITTDCVVLQLCIKRSQIKILSQNLDILTDILGMFLRLLRNTKGRKIFQSIPIIRNSLWSVILGTLSTS